jgi:NitT/TauT family transport system permease protein
MKPDATRRRGGLFRRQVMPVALAVFLALAAWELAARAMDARIIFPGPADTVVRLAALLAQPKFWWSLAGTCLRTLGAFGLSLAVSVPLGLLTGHSRFWEAFCNPYLAVLRSTPVISVILVGILWFSPDLVPVFVTILMVVPILTGAVMQGVRQQDTRLLELAAVHHWSLWTRLRHLSLPAVKPYLHSSSHFALGTAWKAVAAAEVLSQPGLGLGSRMQDARIYLDTAAVFALTLSIVLLSVVGDLVIGLLFRAPAKAAAKPAAAAEV